MMFISHKKGFTLVELLVSLGIFTFVMTISMGAILSVLDANQKSQTLRAVMDNLDFTLEGVTRTIRFGTNYHCGNSGNVTKPNDCAGGSNTVTVLSSSNNQVTYSLVGGRIARSINGGQNYYVTSPDVTIQTLTFYVFGSYPYVDPSGGTTDHAQAKVIMVVKGFAGVKTITQSTFALETTISQRKFDY